jgi:signal transduction histidine kinase/CheY-like chemotaxis protein
LELSGDGLLWFDEADRIVYANAAAADVLGRGVGDVVGATLHELGWAVLQDRLDAALAEGRHEPDCMLCPTGEKRVYWRVEDAPGDTGGHVLALRDETKHFLNDSWTQAIITHSGNGLVVFTRDDMIAYASPTAHEMLGISEDDLVGRTTTMCELAGGAPLERGEPVRCWDVHSCEQVDCPAYEAEHLHCWHTPGTADCVSPSEDGEATPEELRERCDTCEVYLSYLQSREDELEGTTEYTVTDPIQRVLRAQTSPIFNEAGEYLYRVVSLADITREREMEQLKNEFVSTVSHELRTPLTSIKGYVDLVVDGEAGEINEVQREFLTIVQENSDRLVTLINDLLDISRIESGRVHLNIQPVDVGEVFADVLGTFRTMIDQAGLEVEVEVHEALPQASADRDRLGQVLANLVSNAVKYSPEGGTVTLRAQPHEDWVVASVADQGIGIEEEHLEQLFSKFYRVDSSYTRDIGGTGLGLSICKSIVELMGGHIGVRSEAGVGSTFSFSLPQAAEPEEPALEALPQRGEGSILVVDRDPTVADLIERYLTRHGYEVLKAHTARDALRFARDEQPAAITLDVMLDDMDGFDVLRRLTEDETTKDIPVVVLSIVCDEGRSCRLGAARYLEKPIEQERLVATLEDLLGPVPSPVVLVVDDDRDTVGTLERTLAARGIDVMTAFDGREALESIAERRPDLVLLDLRMPVMDGYEVIHEMKTSPETMDIPIVAMTAYHVDSDKSAILSLAVTQVSKPLEAEDLVIEIESLLEEGM